jgi:hypothetical protein
MSKRQSQIDTRKGWTGYTVSAHFGELVEQFSDRPSNDIHGFMREIDEGFDSLL